ncbi:HlyD family secretion protein [Halomonas denitrificans]|uniref:HlyD family secretion protein n=1 Tax=Halomonas TaxID=2745 RepID=UPI001C97DAC8|nr:MULTISPECIES: HlyD family secretion protein [Halomonas]MBY5930357.1 HlyD family secretion protein [Halomonas sp. DP8Y7-3]MCA0976725.1 HlyD family secretion protein [Halomonas denitrificans]
MTTLSRWGLRGLVVGVATLSVLWGRHWWLVGRYLEKTDNAYVYANEVCIRSELVGLVRKVSIADNQRVHAGDILVELDATDVEQQLAQVRADEQVARSQLAQAGRSIERQRAAIDEVRALVSAAEIQLEQALNHLERSRSLASRQYASEQQRQDDEASVHMATANLAARRAALTSAQRQLDVALADEQSAEARVASAQAAVEVARHQVEKATLRAPRDGVVGAITVEEGDLAQPSLALMYLVPIDSAYVVANFKETQTERMRIGQPVRLQVDAYPDVDFEGVVESLAPATGAQFSLLPRDNATGNFNKIVQRVPVKIRLIGPGRELGALRAGLSVVPEVDTRIVDGDPLGVRLRVDHQMVIDAGLAQEPEA